MPVTGPRYVNPSDPLDDRTHGVHNLYLKKVMAVRENIEVEVGVDSAGKGFAVISDRNRGRAWSGEADSQNQAATEALKKFLGHRTAPEYIGD